jgi:Cdc6-like AAA superfamily ATPase
MEDSPRWVIHGPDAKILQWLSSADPSTSHNAACGKHNPMTANWLIYSDEFCVWKGYAGEFLLVQGIPGCGKTVLCSSVIEDVKSFCTASRKYDYAYFYFDHNDTQKQTVTDLLRSMVVQLSCRRRELPSEVRELFQQHGIGNQEPRKEDLISTFLSLLEGSRRTYLIIDALDACAERDSLSDLLIRLFRTCRDKIALLATSRIEWNLAMMLDDIVSANMIIPAYVVDSDIRLHVRNCLNQDLRLKMWSDSVKEEIKHTLVEQANGMYAISFSSIT